MYGLTTIKKLIKSGGQRTNGLAAVVLAALVLLPALPATAQTRGTFTLTFKGSLTGGLAPDQMLRLTVSNHWVHPAQGGESSGGDVDGDGKPDDIIVGPRGHVKVFDGRGHQIFQTDEVVIPVGGFHSFDINRDRLNLPGEPGTGRIQVRLELIFVASVATPQQAEEIKAVGFPYTLEVIDNRSGANSAMMDGSVRNVSSGISGF